MIEEFSLLNGGKYFFLGIFQTYLVFIATKKNIKYFSGTTRVEPWKSNGKSEESIENITKSENNFAPTFVDHPLLRDINFNEHCLIKSNVSNPEKVINLYISCTLVPQLRNLDTEFTFSNCSFGSVKLTKNAALDKCKYTGYGIGFDSCSELFHLQIECMEKI